MGLDQRDQVALALIGDYFDQVHQVLAFGRETHGFLTDGLPHRNTGEQPDPLGLEIFEALERGADGSRQGGLDLFQAADCDGAGLAIKLHESAQAVLRLQTQQLMARSADGLIECLAGRVGHLASGIGGEGIVFSQGIQGVFLGQILKKLSCRQRSNMPSAASKAGRSRREVRTAV